MTSIGPAGATALYRIYDQSDLLLYVGITHNPGIRFGSHAEKKQWWGDVARVQIEWHASRGAAEAAEVVAILAEQPKWNIALPDEDGRYRTGVGRPTMQD